MSSSQDTIFVSSSTSSSNEQEPEIEVAPQRNSLPSLETQNYLSSSGEDLTFSLSSEDTPQHGMGLMQSLSQDTDNSISVSEISDDDEDDDNVGFVFPRNVYSHDSDNSRDEEEEEEEVIEVEDEIEPQSKMSESDSDVHIEEHPHRIDPPRPLLFDDDDDIQEAIRMSLVEQNRKNNVPSPGSGLTLDEKKAIEQSRREYEYQEEIRAVITNPIKLRKILSTIPGVDPYDPGFDQFYV